MSLSIRNGEAGCMTTTTIDNHPASATLENVKGNLYLRLWRGVPRELGFLLLSLPIAVAGFSVSVSLLSAGAGTIITFILGVFFLAALLYVGRGFGTLELVRLGWAGRPRIDRPEWPREPGFWGWARTLFGSGHYWLYALHTTVINFAISLITWTIAITWIAVGLGGATYWFWDRFTPDGTNSWFLSRWLYQVFGDRSVDWAASGIDWSALDNVAQLVLGIVFLATLPFVTRGLVLLHHSIASGVLGPFHSDALRREVSNLSASRGAAISAEGHSLRRLERDIHDGPQQRLVRLQMDLAAAERQLDTDPDAARALIEEATLRSHEALEELRALSRGFAPPILLDRGLIAALESLAARSSVTVTVTNALDADLTLPQEIERNAYFVASELVANATKHSGATEIRVAVAMRRIPEQDSWWLDVVVTDDGHGGAAATEGHGLAGLDERLRGLGGTLELDSPVGGPTTATGHLPVTY